MAAHVLYRFYAATGQLLYIGITMNPRQRFKAHKSTKDWWDDIAEITMEHYDDRAALAAAEREAIQAEHPLHNIVHAVPAPAPGPPEPTIVDYFAELSARCRAAEKEAEEREIAAYRARAAAIAACDLCDDMGYRNLYLCNHSERTGYLRDALRRVRRDRLQIVESERV